MTVTIGSPDDVRARLRAVLPAGWFADRAPILDAVLSGIAAAWSAIFTQLAYVRAQTRIATATDMPLDLIAVDFFGGRVARRPAQSDDSLRAVLRRELLRERATRAGLIASLTDLTGRAPTVFEPSRPADTGGWGQRAALAYGAAGGWGSLALPAQVFVTARRPAATGIATLAGWGTKAAGWSAGRIAYATLAQAHGQVTDADILAAITFAMPTGNRRLDPYHQLIGRIPMDRTIVYPGAIPLDTDLLSVNRNAMVGLGSLAQMVLGTGIILDGLACAPTAPASLTVTVGPGSIAALQVVDPLAYGSLPADPVDPLLKIGINLAPTSFTLTAPASSGQAINWLIEAAFSETDNQPTVLPYYNAANPAQPYAGPSNTGTAQNTLRSQRVALQLRQGVPAAIGSQQTPAVDAGWVGLYVITVQFGQTAIVANNIALLPTAPFLTRKLPQLLPGFASGVQVFPFVGNSSFTVPVGVTQVEVELWGGGSGSYASQINSPSGGGSAGGYARKRIIGLTPGQVIPLTVGGGGSGGTTGGQAPTAGGTSNFGGLVSATGGGLNVLSSVAAPQNGHTPGGVGSGGDLNLQGSDGSHGSQNQFASGGAGLGGAAPHGGGARNGGTVANAGLQPGGGASGAGNGSSGNTPYNGAPGGDGMVVVRW